MGGRLPTTRELEWLAGILEGEGSFSVNYSHGKDKVGYPDISLSMSDRDVVERVCRLLEVRLKGYQSKRRTKNGKLVKFAWTSKLKGARAAGWMQTLFPFMGIRRQEQIGLALEKGGYWVRPTYEVQLNAVLGFRVQASSVSNAIETAKAIGREMVEAKGFQPISFFVGDLQRIYPEETCYEAREAMAATANQEGSAT